uniref:Uncharacterized protein n=1 Tax=Oryza rufipogon TaxID=4529 RepID=A0A0E0PN94_ORYRU
MATHTTRRCQPTKSIQAFFSFWICRMEIKVALGGFQIENGNNGRWPLLPPVKKMKMENSERGMLGAAVSMDARRCSMDAGGQAHHREGCRHLASCP